ncbi:mediator of RNA polymerase II transcription subunit 16-like [Diadema setosum]|uniref:mediator of RNA polymerase II transcription subunit 16-like n=1 Tax=Diadema setosum TaxID=31175 RepID=UPI003B3A7F8E
MERAFVTDWPNTDANVCIKTLIDDSVCSWSCRNIAAFTAIGNPTLPEEREVYRPIIHVVDPDRPWEVCSFGNQHRDAIQALRWNSDGTQLLSADAMGTVFLWKMKHYLMNDWYCAAESHLQGEPIVAIAWLHNGMKISYNVDNIDSPNMLDKFSRTRFTPSLAEFGMRPMEGWVSVTGSGLISATVLRSGKTVVVTERLGNARSHIALADIAFTSSGHILVATSDGGTRCPLQVYRVSLSWDDDKLQMSTEYLPSLYMQCLCEVTSRDKYPSITSVQFISKECTEQQLGLAPTEQLLVCASGMMGSCIEYWTLKKEAIHLHKLFQAGSPHHRDMPTTLKWVFGATYTDSSVITAIALPKLPLKLSMNSLYNGPGMAFAVANQDGTIKLLHRPSLKVCAALRYEGVLKADPGPPAKRPNLNGKHLVCMEMSATCCSLLAIDRTGALCIFKLEPTLGQNLDSGTARAHTISQVVHLLEYCLVTGYDWWDLLLAIIPNMVDTVLDRLSESVNRQSRSTQELLFTRLVAVKSSLYRLAASGSGKAVDCFGKLLLHSTSNVFKSLLRPVSSSAQDKGPAERLTNLCSTSMETDPTNLLKKLDTKEYYVEPSTLQSLQPLIQWVADYTIVSLAAVPPPGSPTNKPGVSLMRDVPTLVMLRELLLMTRMWGRLQKNCLPVFTTTSDELDVLALLFRLVSQIWVNYKDEQPTELDESLIDECTLLPSQVGIPPWDLSPVTEGYTGKIHVRHGQSSFQFGMLPGRMISIATFSFGPEIYTRSLMDRLHQKFDLVRKMSLGVKPHKDIRRCSRCSCISLLPPITASSNTVRILWEKRWERGCLCGGLWRKVSVHPS